MHQQRLRGVLVRKLKLEKYWRFKVDSTNIRKSGNRIPEYSEKTKVRKIFNEYSEN